VQTSVRENVNIWNHKMLTYYKFHLPLLSLLLPTPLLRIKYVDRTTTSVIHISFLNDFPYKQKEFHGSYRKCKNVLTACKIYVLLFQQAHILSMECFMLYTINLIFSCNLLWGHITLN
jgi:hypothetical protein